MGFKLFYDTDGSCISYQGEGDHYWFNEAGPLVTQRGDEDNARQVWSPKAWDHLEDDGKRREPPTIV